jgi:hypothetical protein
VPLAPLCRPCDELAGSLENRDLLWGEHVTSPNKRAASGIARGRVVRGEGNAGTRSGRVSALIQLGFPL